jgi:SHS2 domain-containing protein
VTGEAGHEYFEVEADVGIRAWGPDRSSAFAAAAGAVLALNVDPGGVEARESREVRAQADSPDRLLVSFVNECLYVHEIEGFAASAVEMTLCTDSLAHALLHGEPIDPDRHRMGTIVKAATFHGLGLREQPGRCEITLVVDV